MQRALPAHPALAGCLALPAAQRVDLKKPKALFISKTTVHATVIINPGEVGAP